MKKTVKRMLAAGLAAAMLVAAGMTGFAADEDTETKETKEVNVTLYKSGMTTTSMGNDAFEDGGILTYNYDDDGNVVSTDVELTAKEVTYMGFMTGYLTSMTLCGEDLVPNDSDDDGQPETFTGRIYEEIALDTAYEVTVNISVSGFMDSDTAADMVFSEK